MCSLLPAGPKVGPEQARPLASRNCGRPSHLRNLCNLRMDSPVRRRRGMVHRLRRLRRFRADSGDRSVHGEHMFSLYRDRDGHPGRTLRVIGVLGHGGPAVAALAGV